MKILTMTGSVPNDSVLPTWNEAFPALIYPGKIRVRDGFETDTAGAMTGRALPYSTIGTKTWGGGSNSFNISTSGYITQAGTAVTQKVFDLGVADCEVYGRIYLGTVVPGRAVGVILRYDSPGNFILARLAGSGAFQLQKSIGGTLTTLASAPFLADAGAQYDIRIKAVGDQITAFIGDIALSATDSTFNTETEVGLYSMGSGGRFYEFIAGY